MKSDRQKMLLFIKLSYVILFFLSLSCDVAWTTFDSLGISVPDVVVLFSSIYVFIFLAVIGLILAIKTSSKEQPIFVVLNLVAGLNILVRGFMLLLNGKNEIVSFVSFGIGIITMLGNLYIVIRTIHS